MSSSCSPDRAAREVWAAHNRTARGRREWPCEELVRALSRVPRGRLAVEVGCGAGANLRALSRRFDRVVGVDFDAQALGWTYGTVKENHLWNVAWLRGEALALPLASASADYVVDAMVSQHLPWAAHVAAYREYRRVLRPGGRLFLYHLSALTSHEHYDEIDQPEGIDLFPEAGLVCLPGPAELADLLGDLCGFSPVEARGLAREYPDARVAHYAVLEGTAR